jgi:hypothetical protein
VINPAMLARGRALSDSIMPDTCRVTRASAEPVFNEETLLYDDPTPATVYEGPFRARGVSAVPGEIDAASQLLVETDASVAFPVDADSAGIAKNDELEWVTSAFDAALVGAKVRITGPFTKTSHAVARRFRVEEMS